jgi:hypothetical protein
MAWCSLNRWVAATTLLGAAGASQAAFSVGNSVELTYLFPDTSTVFAGPIVVAGPSDTAPGFAGAFNVTFTDTSIEMTLTRNAGINDVAFDGIRFIDKNATLSFSNYVLDIGATDYSGFDASRLTHATDTLYVNVARLPGLQGQHIVLSAVPEPSSFGLMAAGLGVFWLLAWRGSAARRRSSVGRQH